MVVIYSKVKRLRLKFYFQYLTSALGYESSETMKLSGKSLPSLMKLIIRSETVDMTKRPVYTKGEAVESEIGVDFTLKKSYTDFFNECLDNEKDIYLQRYTITVGIFPLKVSNQYYF